MEEALAGPQPQLEVGRVRSRTQAELGAEGGLPRTRDSRSALEGLSGAPLASAKASSSPLEKYPCPQNQAENGLPCCREVLCP